MTSFILSEMPSSQLNGKTYTGRLILDDVSHGTHIETIDADPITRKIIENGEEKTVIDTSAWQVAREKIGYSKFEHHVNAGWFMPEEKKVAA